jgi:serine/threonine protein phosphatase 1
MWWVNNGGDATIQSWRDAGGFNEEKIVKWMKSLPIILDDPAGYFVHAGLMPNARSSEQVKDDILWVRDEFLNSDYIWSKPVIHGHTPMSDVFISHRRVGLDTGACFSDLGKLSAYDVVNNKVYQVERSELDSLE